MSKDVIVKNRAAKKNIVSVMPKEFNVGNFVNAMVAQIAIKIHKLTFKNPKKIFKKILI